MRTSTLILASSASAFSIFACSQLLGAKPDAASATGPVIAEIAKSYRAYQNLTPDLTFVNPELAMLCRGANQQEVETAQKTKGPHANTAIRIFMNESAARTFAAGRGAYDPGAVIVKEKMPLGYSDTAGRKRVRPNEGVGGMVKRAPGFDPEHGDWEYFYFEDPAKIETGAIASCVKCHAGAKAKDHVFGTWASHPDSAKRRQP